MGIVRAADDVEAGVVGAATTTTTTEPLLLRHCGKEDHDKIRGSPEEAAASDCGSEGRPDTAGSLRMVLLSTAVAVCGSFEFGTCVRMNPPPPPCIFAFHVLSF